MMPTALTAFTVMLAVAATGLAAGRHLSDAPDGAAVLDTIGAADGRTGLEPPGLTDERLPMMGVEPLMVHRTEMQGALECAHPSYLSLIQGYYDVPCLSPQQN